MKMLKTTLMASAMAVGLIAGPASAHHAVQAQFDVTKNIIITGVLAQVDWQNPHAWFHFDVKNPDGSITRWSTETVGPNGLRRLGLSDRRLFVVGDTYKVDINPDRSGKPLGFTNAFWFPDGKFVKVGFPENPNGELPPDK
jgi:hypothetical protein